MFWIKRIKAENSDTHWAVPYGDLMSLLLAVFVMIAAMSELHSGSRFDEVSGAVRRAFGFSVDEPTRLAERPLTLLERLEQVGTASCSQVRPTGANHEVLAACDVLVDRDNVMVRIDGETAFPRFGAVLQPAAVGTITRVAKLLAGGQNRIEIRGHAGDGPLPAGASFRDGLDLSYARARAAADVLLGEGVDRSRIHLTVWENNTRVANCRVEIIVQAVTSAAPQSTFAEKERVSNG